VSTGSIIPQTRQRSDQYKTEKAKQEQQKLQPDKVTLWDCTVLGGTGYAVLEGETVALQFNGGMLVLQRADGSKMEDIPYVEVVELAIMGPGSVTTGGGFIGGGFGIEGALEGMAIGTILNLLTTRTKIHTFITLVTHLGELHLHYGGMEPGTLRIALSKVFTTLRRLDPTWMRARLDRLEALRAQRVLTESEFERLKERLLVDRTPMSRQL
jgi:hypothetical protein